MSMAWVAVGTAVLGAGTTLYGINAQKKANQATAETNAETQDKQNRAAWSNWLMTKGIAPTTSVEAGVMPTAGKYTAVNTKLPFWANVTYGSLAPGSKVGGGIRLVKKGTATTGITGMAAVPAANPNQPTQIGSPGLT